MKSKLKSDTIDADLSSLKDSIAALEEVLDQDDYDSFEASEYCDEIEQLASAIQEALQ